MSDDEEEDQIENSNPIEDPDEEEKEEAQRPVVPKINIQTLSNEKEGNKYKRRGSLRRRLSFISQPKFSNIYQLLSQIKANELIKTRYQVLGEIPPELMDTTEILLNNMSEKRRSYLSKIADQIDPENNIYKDFIDQEIETAGQYKRKVVRKRSRAETSSSLLRKSQYTSEDSSELSFIYSLPSDDREGSRNRHRNAHQAKSSSSNSQESPNSKHKRNLNQIMNKLKRPSTIHTYYKKFQTSAPNFHNQIMESLSYRKRSTDNADQFVYVANNSKFKQVTTAFD